jgi:hypothetical protein
MWNGDCTVDGCRREIVEPTFRRCSLHAARSAIRLDLIAQRMDDVKFRYAIERTLMRRAWQRRRWFPL